MILLDTHVLLWLAEDEARLGKRTREIIASSAAAGNVAVSAISFWEIGMLLSKNRIGLVVSLADFAEAVADKQAFKVIPVDSKIAVETANLPRGIHRDPADRMLIATARHLTCPLATTDSRILAYSAEGHVRTLDASS